MRRVAVCVIGLVFFSFKSFAADTIIVHKDARLDIFTEKQATVNKLTSKMTSTGLYKGYRLQVLNTRNRDEAFKTKSELLQMFPSQKTYISYQSPYFKVRIGNFKEMEDAESFRNQLLKVYHQNAYIVEDGIEYSHKLGEEVTPD